MSSQNFEFERDDRLELATTARLARLRSMPVDATRLEALIQSQLPRKSDTRPQRLSRQLAWWTQPMRAVAAGIAVAAVLAALLLGTSGGPVMASASEMAQFHNDLVSGKVPATRVESMDGANRMLAAQWAQSPQLPNMRSDHVMACCMRSVKTKKVACVLFQGAGTPVTMTVANAADMRSPTSPTVTRNGIEYHVQSAGELNMVMAQRHGRWICLIAAMPTDRLMDLASGLEF